MTVAGVPDHCIAAATTVLGAALVGAQLHDGSSVPKSCIVSSIIGTAALSAAVSHHGSTSKSPEWFCVAGGVIGLLGVGYAVTAHAEISRIPTKCKLYTAVGLAALVGGVAVFAKKK